MKPTTQGSAIQPTLEWAIEKFGADFFTVRWLWTRSANVFRFETRSTLERLEGYENVYGDITNYGLAAAMRNAARITRGEDKEEVKVHAYRLVARIFPAQRRMLLPVLTRAMTITEQSVPTFTEHQEIDIPTFCLGVTSFEESTCEWEMLQSLRRLGLGWPVSTEYDPSYHFLPRPDGENTIRRLPKRATR